MIAIVAAMPEELAALVERARAPRELSRPEQSPFVMLTARVAEHDVALVVTGDGERNARLGSEALFASLPVSRLFVVGVAGAATSELPSGALVVAEEVGFEAGAAWRAEPSSVEAAVGRAGARRGRVVSARAIADTPAAKRAIADTPAAKRALAGAASDAGPVAVDLESATYVAAAVRAGVPWTVLRVISDAADEALPSLLNRARDAGGAVRRGAVALRLLGNPSALPVLLRMRARVRDAAVRLADAVERLMVVS